MKWKIYKNLTDREIGYYDKYLKINIDFFKYINILLWICTISLFFWNTLLTWVWDGTINSYTGEIMAGMFSGLVSVSCIWIAVMIVIELLAAIIKEIKYKNWLKEKG